MSSSVVRVPDSVLLESKRIAALRGQQAGDLLAVAWREYFANHRDEFAADLEEAARVLRDGTLDDLAALLNRDAEDQAEAAFIASQSQTS
jgi:hypothetical protein